MLKKSLLIVVTLVAQTAGAWGFDGHRRLAKMMHEPLPASSCLAQWIAAQQTSAFQDDACDPDRFRNTSDPSYDPNEWPRHYLEIDYAFPVQTYPRDFEEVKARYGARAEKNGVVPWHVEFMYQRLVEAFQSKNTTQIKKTLAHLSHYITDAFSVLHNTKNFDPNGLHQRWETDMLDSNARLDTLSNRARLYFGTVGVAEPLRHTFEIVEVGNGLLIPLVNADLEHPTDMTAFFNAVQELTARRMGDALTLQASLIASAWVEAGRPRLSGMSNACETEVFEGTLALQGYPLPPPAPPEPDAAPEEGASVLGDEPPLGCACSSNSNGLWLLGALLSAIWFRKARK